MKPFYVWIRLYALATDKDAKAIERKLAPTQATFNGRLFAVKQANGFGPIDLCALFYYVFLYDPLEIGAASYGNLDNVTMSATKFGWFCKQYAAEIKEVGIVPTVINHAPAESVETYKEGLDVNSIKRFL